MIKKILNAIKNKEIDLIMLLITLLVGATVFVLVDSNDELWNFANSYKMFNGYKIYEELNVIITPLFFYIAQIFLKIFGPNILSFRIYNIVISFVFLILIYGIFKSLKVVRRRAIFYTFIIFFIFKGMIGAGANYNMLAMIPILIAIILIIKQKESSILLGTLLFLTFMLKQNVYIFFAMGILIYKFINRKNIKQLFIDLLKIYLTSFAGIAAFLIYLYLDNNLYNFINYCFLGIGEFGLKNTVMSFDGARYIYISIIAIFFTFFLIYNKKINSNIDKETIKKTKCLLSFGIPLLLISYPIINYYHSTLASVIIFMEFIYIIEKTLIENMKIDIKKEKILYKTLILICIIYMYSVVYGAIREINKKEIIFNNDGVFCGSMVSKENYEDIQIICDYIKEKKREGIDIKILSYKANIYMININENNEVFDLAFLGNLGKEGEDGVISQIKELQNTLILIPRDSEKIFYQESKKIINYVVDNYEKIGEIQEYSIYKIK